MKNTLCLLALSTLLSGAALAQNLAVETYTLANGFTVMLNPDPTATEVSGAVMVNAGGKNDPANATGIAHYLEHLLFKGTEEMGTADYAAEKVHLDRIVELYDEAAASTDEAERQRLYAEINQEAVAASAYGLPNEFDGLLRELGGTGINAFTNSDITFYYNSFPAHEFPRWLDLYSIRFENPVFRSFQSELEVVYEEKNRSMDNFQSRLIEPFNQEVFKGHPYGEQLVLGTIDHLKNPSLSQMYAFFETNYVANNMALILSGNFDAAAVKPIIEAKFGDWERKELPPRPEYPRRAFSGRESFKVRLTPVPVGLMAYKTVTDTDPDRYGIDVAMALMSNSAQTGYLDRLVQEGKLLLSLTLNNSLMEDGAAVLVFVPKPVVQSFGAAEKLVLGALDEVRQGNFTDADLAAIKSTLYKDFQLGLEDPDQRAVAMGFCYSRGIAWEEYLRYPQEIAAITREDIVRMTEQYFGDDRLVMTSKVGFPKKRKLDKPSYEPVTTDQNATSGYAEDFQAMAPPLPQPDFVDFDTDVQQQTLAGGNTLYYTKNPLNDIFTLRLMLHVGTQTLPELSPLAQAFNNAGTGTYSGAKLKRQFASLGATFFASADRRTLTLNVQGIEANLEEVLALLNGLVNDPVITDATTKVMVDGIATERKLERSTPEQMGRVLLQYGLRGQASQYLARLPLSEVKKLTGSGLSAQIKAVYDTYGATLHYVGQRPASEVSSLLTQELALAQNGERIAPSAGEFVRPTETTIYLVHDKKAVQSQVWYTIIGESFDREQEAAAMAFNSYFGGGFSGLILQEIREYRSLAYSAGGSLDTEAFEAEDPTVFAAFTGSQADKTTDAVSVMLEMLNELPQKPERMSTVVSFLQQSAITGRPGFRSLSQQVQNWQQQGYTQDPNAAAYAQLGNLTFDELVAIHEQYLAAYPVTVTIYGDKKSMDLDQLAQMGNLIEVDADDIMNK